MPMKAVPTNYRIELYADLGNIWDDRHRLEALEKILPQIRRHIDGITDVSIVHDVKKTCEYCGRDWTEEGKFYNGGCCERDEQYNQDVTAIAKKDS